MEKSVLKKIKIDGNKINSKINDIKVEGIANLGVNMKLKSGTLE